MALKELMAKINKKFGKDTMVIASEAVGLDVVRIPTGSVELDVMTGGGWARGRILELAGDEGGCKTSLALLSCKEYLTMYPKSEVVWIDAEQTFNRKWAKRLIGSEFLKRIGIVQPDSGEQACDLVAFSVSNVGECLVVVDSIAAMTPEYELENETSKKTQALHARMINLMIRKVNARLKKNLTEKDGEQTTILTINQLREKIGIAFGDPRTAPGGKGKDFAYSQRVWVQPSSKIKKTIKGKERKVGLTIGLFHKKTKVGGDLFGRGKFNFYARKRNNVKYMEGAIGIDNYESAVRVGTVMGIVKRVGNTTYKYRNIESKKGIDYFCLLLSEKPKTFARLCDAIKAEALKEDEDEEQTPKQKRKKSKAGKKDSKKPKRGKTSTGKRKRTSKKR